MLHLPRKAVRTLWQLHCFAFGSTDQVLPPLSYTSGDKLHDYELEYDLEIDLPDWDDEGYDEGELFEAVYSVAMSYPGSFD